MLPDVFVCFTTLDVEGYILKSVVSNEPLKGKTTGNMLAIHLQGKQGRQLFDETEFI